MGVSRPPASPPRRLPAILDADTARDEYPWSASGNCMDSSKRLLGGISKDEGIVAVRKTRGIESRPDNSQDDVR
jgi:hypothetical protein